MTASAPLRVGVVGAGGMGRTHLAAWRRIGADVTVFSPGGATGRGAALAAEQNVRVAARLADLLAAAEVIDICTPTDTHHDIAVAAFGAGRHVICEKPLALTSAEAADIADRAHAAGLQLHVAHVVRYFAAYAAAHAAVRGGLIGAPTELRLRRVGAAPAAPWFYDVTRSGGVLMDQMIHDFDYARWVAGRVLTVEARVRRCGANDVTAEATLRHASGAVTRLTGGWLAPETPFTTALSIIGSDGTLTQSATGDTSGAVLLTRAGAAPEQILDAATIAADDPYLAQLREFAAAIAGGDGPAPRVTVSDALAAVELVLAALRSAAGGRPEPVRHPEFR